VLLRNDQCAHQGLLRQKLLLEIVTQDLVFAEIYWLLLHALKIKKKILFLLCSVETFHISHMQNELVSALCFVLGVTCAITGSFGCGKTYHLAGTYKGISSIYFLVVLW
jgi:hypothetical protein